MNNNLSAPLFSSVAGKPPGIPAPAVAREGHSYNSPSPLPITAALTTSAARRVAWTNASVAGGNPLSLSDKTSGTLYAG